MRDRLVVILCVAMIIISSNSWANGEVAGKLERVDVETVTLRDANDDKHVVRVDLENRREAAQYLGKTVTVDLLNEGGLCKAVRFRSSR